MDDQFATVVLPPDDKRFRVNKGQALAVARVAASPLKHDNKEKKEFALPGCIPSFEALPLESLPSTSSATSTRTSAPRGVLPAQKYVNYRGKEVETDAEDAVEYDLDREDTVWLRMANERRRREGRKMLSESLLERCIDRLEKESHFQQAKSAATASTAKSAALLHIRHHHFDSDVPCCICNDDDTSDANLIIFCDMCNIAVHQECYGVPYIPEGQWLCRRCQLSPSAPVKCALCHFTNGAFKQTSDGQWAHVICAIWLSEVHFANTAFLEPIEGVSHSLQRRCKLRCLVCKRKGGACLQCSKRSCCRSFHVTCAQHAGMRMVIQEDRDRKTNAMIINRHVYCHKHSASATEQDEISRAAWKRSVDEQLRKARRQLVTSNRAVPQVSIPVIPSKKVNAIRAELGIDNIDDVRNYWALKRRSRCGVPLIRRLQVYHSKKALGQSAILGGTSTESAGSETETSMAGVLLSRGGMRLQPEHLYAHRLRSNLEKVRLLCELVRKREKIKREYVHTTETMLLKWTKPISQILTEALDKLEEKDHLSVFAVPVRDDEVPGYSAVIKRPVAFSTMRAKLATYKRVADLKQDFQLMMANCDTFNRQNPHYWGYGHRIRRIGLNVIRAAEEEERANSASWLLEHCNSASISLLDDAEFARLTDVPSAVAPKKSSSRSAGRSEPKSGGPAKPSASRKEKGAPLVENEEDIGPTRKRRKQKDDKAENDPSEEPNKARFATPLVPVINGQIATPPLHTPKSNGGVNSLKSLRDSYRKSIAESAPGFRGRATRQHGYFTEISSASDTAGTSSMDEDLEPKVVRLERTRRRSAAALCSSNGDVTGAHEFEHNDIVLAQLEGSLKMPARVLDLRMRLDLDRKFPFEKALQSKPPGNGHTLVVLFDLVSTWKWFPSTRLTPLDLTAVHNTCNGDSQASDAYARAKKFWRSMIQG